MYIKEASNLIKKHDESILNALVKLSIKSQSKSTDPEDKKLNLKLDDIETANLVMCIVVENDSIILPTHCVYLIRYMLSLIIKYLPTYQPNILSIDDDTRTIFKELHTKLSELLELLEQTEPKLDC